MGVLITWTNTQQKASGMMALGKRIGTTHAHKWGTEVGEAAKESIQGSVMSGGINQTKKGGPRILSSSMYRSADSEVTTARGASHVIAGFISGEPAHTIFQERGTRDRRIDSKSPRLTPTKGKGMGRGIPPMLAIPKAKGDMAREASNAGVRMMTKIAAEWNAL